MVEKHRDSLEKVHHSEGFAIFSVLYFPIQWPKKFRSTDPGRPWEESLARLVRMFSHYS